MPTKTLNATKRWTIYNAQTESLAIVTDAEFKAILEAEGVKLKGEYIEVSINHPEPSRIKQTQRVWVDAILNSQYFK